MTPIKEGDEVRVFDLLATCPEGGWPGKVIGVLSRAIWIEYDEAAQGFRYDNHASNDYWQHQWFRTAIEGYAPDLVAADRRIRIARAKKAGTFEAGGSHADLPDPVHHGDVFSRIEASQEG